MTTQDRRAAEEIARCYGAERTRCADVIFELVQKAREEERERCAAKLDSMSREYDTASGHAGKLIAAANAIRALPESGEAMTASPQFPWSASRATRRRRGKTVETKQCATLEEAQRFVSGYPESEIVRNSVTTAGWD